MKQSEKETSNMYEGTSRSYTLLNENWSSRKAKKNP